MRINCRKILISPLRHQIRSNDVIDILLILYMKVRFFKTRLLTQSLNSLKTEHSKYYNISYLGFLSFARNEFLLLRCINKTSTLATST